MLSKTTEQGQNQNIKLFSPSKYLIWLEFLEGSIVQWKEYGFWKQDCQTLALGSPVYYEVGGMLLRVSRASIFPALKKGVGQGLLIVTPWGDGKNVLKLDNAIGCTTLEIH